MVYDVTDGKPLDPVDTAWLHMEDPTNLMMVTGIFVLDRPLDMKRLKDTIRHRMAGSFPRLKLRVLQDGSSASWMEDPTFDIDAHVHRIALPSPGDDRVLREVVSDLMSTPLDFTKPLFQIHLLENHGPGCVVVFRIHHCIGDGVALVHVILSMTDAFEGAPWPKPPGSSHPLALNPLERISSLFGGLSAAAKTTRDITGTVLHEGMEALLHPSHVLDVVQSLSEGIAILFRLVLRPSDPETVLKGKLGTAKRAAWSAALPLQEVKAVGKTEGATVNDVLVAAVTGALRRYLEKRGTNLDGIEINAMVPVNLRGSGEPGRLGNRFGLIYLGLPVGAPNPFERLRIVKKRMDAIKTSPEPVVVFQILNALGLAPREVAGLMVETFGKKSTAVLTNVIGPKEPIWFAGERVRTAMFWVPQSGRMGLGVSIFSYAGEVVLGVAGDARLVPDPEEIASAFGEEFRILRDNMVPVGGRRRRRRPKALPA